MSELQFPAMGTQIDCWGVESGDRRVIDWFEEVESVASRFRPESELSLINRGDASSIVSDLMAQILRSAERARDITDGLVDVGLGRILESWGYDRTFAEVSGLDARPAPTPRGEWSLEGRRLQRSPGTSIDLGGIAKGWSADRAVEDGLASVVSAGGDLRSSDPATVATVTDGRGSDFCRIQVGRGALATSSVEKRRWVVDGAEASHIIDPRTMRPVRTPVLSATVLAPTAADAEAGAKAVVLLGEDGLAWAASRTWIDGAVVLWRDGSVYGTPGLEVAA